MGRYLGRESTYGVFEKQKLSPDSTLKEFTLDHQVGSSTSILVINNVNGVTKILEPGVDYSITHNGEKIAFTSAPAGDDGVGISESLYIIYLGKQLLVPAVAGRSPLLVQASGNGTQTTFQVTNEVVLTEHGLIVFKNGVQQSHGNTRDFTIDDNQVVFSSAPENGTKLDFYVFGGVERLTLNVADVADGEITPDKLNLYYGASYAPSVTTFSPMASSASVQEAKYLDLGKIIKLRLKILVTLTGSGDNKIRVSLPKNNDGDTNISSTVVISSNDSLENGIVRWGASNAIDIYRQAGINYLTGGKVYTIEATIEYNKA